MQCRLHELANKKRISVTGASKLLANTLYSYKGMGLSMVGHKSLAAIYPLYCCLTGQVSKLSNGLLLLFVWHFRVIAWSCCLQGLPPRVSLLLTGCCCGLQGTMVAGWDETVGAP